MKYQEALDYLEAFQESGGVKPENIGRLCEYLGNPQEELQFADLTNIKGNGSVQAYVASVMKCGGYRVGRYPSPVFTDARDKILVNDSPITQKAFCQGMELLRGGCENMTEMGLPHPTALELETALAFWYFREKKCDLVLLENTSTIVSSGEVQDAVKVAAVKAFAPEPAESAECTGVRYGLEHQRFHYGGYKNLEISLAGKTQPEKAALALELVKALAEKGYAVKESAVREGLKAAKVPGCFQIIGKKPYFVVDRTETEADAKELAGNIEQYFGGRRILYIMGFSRDMEYEKMIQRLHVYGDLVIAVTPPHYAGAGQQEKVYQAYAGAGLQEKAYQTYVGAGQQKKAYQAYVPDQGRALPAYDLAMEVSKVHPNVTAVDSLEEAVEISRLLAGKEDVILACGALSYLGKLARIVEKK